MVGVNLNASDSLGLGSMFTGIFDNIITTKDEKQQNQNNLLLGEQQLGLTFQLGQQQNAALMQASQERNKVILAVAVLLAILFTLFLIFKK